MQTFKLIQARGFGERLNELTSLIYANFGDFFLHTRGYLVAITLLTSLYIELFSPTTLIGRSLRFLLLSIFLLMLVVAFTTLVKRVGVEGRKEESLRTLWPWLMKYERTILLTGALPLLILCLLGNKLFVEQPESEITGLLISLFFFTIVLPAAIAPLFSLINVVVFEQKSGVEAVRRAIQLLTTSMISTALYYFIIALMGSILPTLISLPTEILEEVCKLTNNEFGLVDEEHSVYYYVFHYLFSSISVFAHLLYLLLISLSSILVYGNAVEKRDNVSFLKQLHNFDNL